MSQKDYTLVSEGFDNYFNGLISNATEEQREAMPEDIFFKFKRNKEGRYLDVGKTNFFEKLSILWKVFKKDIYIFIRDDENGITGDDFRQWEREELARAYNDKNARDLITRAEFVLGANDICNGMHFRRMVGASGMFRYLTENRGQKVSSTALARNGLRDLCRMLIYYEGSKKKMAREVNLTVPEWYILLHFSDGVEKKGSQVYSGLYFHAFNASQAQMLNGLKRLTHAGFIQKFGVTNIATYRITALGMDLINKVVTKYVLNY